MTHEKENTRPVAGTTEQAVGADFAGHVPNFDDTTDYSTTRGADAQ